MSHGECEHFSANLAPANGQKQSAVLDMCCILVRRYTHRCPIHGIIICCHSVIQRLLRGFLRFFVWIAVLELGIRIGRGYLLQSSLLALACPRFLPFSSCQWSSAALNRTQKSIGLHVGWFYSIRTVPHPRPWDISDWFCFLVTRKKVSGLLDVLMKYPSCPLEHFHGVQ